MIEGSAEERRHEDAYLYQAEKRGMDGTRNGWVSTGAPGRRGEARRESRSGSPVRGAGTGVPTGEGAAGKRWHRVDVPSLEEFVPTLPVTVVVPYYEAPEALELTLAALECQTYPRDLFEVVVVDDGSKIPLRHPGHTDLDVRVVHQEDLGFGLARARNTGARAASHGILIFLDCDMIRRRGR